MKYRVKYIAFLFFTFSLFHLAAQTNTQAGQNYWQQQVDYNIEVTLNDTVHVLNAFITINYTNNSPDTLGFIYLHLWPNAYNDQSTPLARQMLENGKTAFWYSKPQQRGFMDRLNFKLNGEVCKWQFTDTSNEICKVLLNTPLKPGEKVTIFTPFRVKIPETFSRLGHIGQSYQITQWYPKPAVFDKYGWHPFPYLDQGEFYSEFGSFDVSITLPENYIVGSTGDLQDTAEINWMNKKAEQAKSVINWGADVDMSFPASAKTTKTLHFKQSNVHDFAWFADKRYHVLKGEVELPTSHRRVTTWALFTNNQADLWARANEYLHDAIQYYSLWVGDYPYKQVTAVDGTKSEGGGMEYPNITLIGEEKSAFSLDDVITHEVGHNWFYGILGSNERDHAWMDEGINSYYENRYIKLKYPAEHLLNDLSPGIRHFLNIDQYKYKYIYDFGYQFTARENMDQPIEQTSSKFTYLNYDALVYGKTALIFDYLQDYLGKDVFDSIMQSYFQQWQYKHPQPEDVRHIFESKTGKDLSWFFDDLLKTTKKIDYKIQGVSLKKADPEQAWENDSLLVTLKNINQVASPVSVSAIKNDSVLFTIWTDGFKGERTVSIPKTGADKIEIDPAMNIPEINRKNNIYKLNKLAHKFNTLRLQFLASIENQKRTQILFTPYFGWNNYDKTQVGIALFSPFLPKRKFEYIITPAIGTGSKQFVGFANFNYNFFPDKVRKFTLGVKSKRFSYLLIPKNLTFNKLEPYLNIAFKKRNARSDYNQTLNIRSVLVWQQWINPLDSIDYAHNVPSWQRYYVNEALYKVERASTLYPFDITLTAQQGKNFFGIWTEAHFKINYKMKNQGLFIRLFAGGFPWYNRQNSDIGAPLPALYLSNNTWYNANNFRYWLQKDYTYDENFVDRNGFDKYLSHQVTNSEGGFYSLTMLGQTNSYLASANISSTIYQYVPIRPYVSFALFGGVNNKPIPAAEFGLNAIIIKNMIEVHLPLATTSNISQQEQLNGIDKWYKKFSFTLKIQLPNAIDILKQLNII
jgi:hypothetical protein